MRHGRETLCEELRIQKRTLSPTSTQKIFKRPKVREFPYDMVVKNLDELRTCKTDGK